MSSRIEPTAKPTKAKHSGIKTLKKSKSADQIVESRALLETSQILSLDLIPENNDVSGYFAHSHSASLVINECPICMSAAHDIWLCPVIAQVEQAALTFNQFAIAMRILASMIQ